LFLCPSILDFFVVGFKTTALGNKSYEIFWKKFFTLGGKEDMLEEHTFEKCNVFTQLNAMSIHNLLLP
jgi:hypothetical protein